MKHNERKIQILSLLQEKPLTLRQLRELAGIGAKHLNVLTYKYRRQGLVERTDTNPIMVALTTRGRERLVFLIDR